MRGIPDPVLVRERLTPVDRAAFTARGEPAATLGMSPFDARPFQDSGRLSDNAVAGLKVGEAQTIDRALRSRQNALIVRHFLEESTENEQPDWSTPAVQISLQGLQRLKSAPVRQDLRRRGAARLTQTFLESQDPGIWGVKNALFGSLPDVGRSRRSSAPGSATWA